MKANELLLWLSARREGSWQQFRQAVAELHSQDIESDGEPNDGFPLHQQLRLNLERLAHVEFFAAGCTDGWRVAPPTLAAHPFMGGVRGILCGARSPALWEKVLCASSKLDCKTLNSLDAPEAIRVFASDESALEHLAELTGLHFQPDAPLAILLHLPPCDPPLSQQSAAEYPQGADWSIHGFDETHLEWRKITRHEAENTRFGMLRFMIYFQRTRYFLRWNSVTFEMPRAVALYALLHRHRRSLLQYNRETAMFSVPAICRPPCLLERALVLCSGLPPTYNAERLTYPDVPPEIAYLAAELLRQPIV